ncbi:hypothetical protein EON64_17185, partial [archaeon]
MGLVSSDLSKTFQASSAFGDGSAARKAAIVLSVFVSVWVISLLAMTYFYNWKRAEAKKQDVSDASGPGLDGSQDIIHDGSQTYKSSVSGNHALSQTERLKNLASAYLAALFPAAFLPASLLEGLCREVYRKHMYINFFFRLHRSHSPIVDIVKVVTLQSFLLFLLALLYDLNVPSDDGSCVLLTSEAACLQRRLLFDASQTYCQWTAFQYADLLATDDDTVYFECVYGDPAVSLMAATYTSIILSLATCLIMDPLEYILSLLGAPTLEDDNSSLLQPSIHDISTTKPAALSNTQKVMMDASKKEVSPAASHLPISNRGDSKSSRSSRESSRFSRVLPLHLVCTSLEATTWQQLEANVCSDCKFVASQPIAFDMTSLELAIHKQSACLLSGELTNNLGCSAGLTRAAFDLAWCLDSVTGLFWELRIKAEVAAASWMARLKIAPMPLRQPVATKNVLSMRDVIEQDLLMVQHAAAAAIEELEEVSQAEIGFEIMVQFVQDILGRNTTAAHIFAMKMEMDYEKVQRVGIQVKLAICLLLLCLNGLFFYFTLLRGISKGLAWQRSYLLAWLLQSVVD